MALPPSSWIPIRDPAVTFSQKAAPPPTSLTLGQIEAMLGKLRPGEVVSKLELGLTSLYSSAESSIQSPALTLQRLWSCHEDWVVLGTQ